MAATNISCTTLTIAGEPISSVLQNVGTSTLGLTKFNGELQADSVSVFGDMDTESVTANTTSAGVLTASSITDTGTLTVSGVSSFQNVTTGALSATSITGSGALTVSGASSLQGVTAASLTTPGTITQTTSGSVAALKAATMDSIAVGASKLFVGTTNSRVGVNTTTPAQALDVVGNIACSGTVTSAGTLTASSNIVQSSGTSTLKAVTMDSAVVTGNLTVDGTTLFVNASNDRVGILTTNPTVPLDVQGAANISGAVTLGSTLNVTGNVSGPGLGNYTYSSVSANAAALQFNVPTDSTATEITLYLYGVGIASNSYFVFRVGETSATILSTAIYNYAIGNIALANTFFTEGGDAKTLLRISPNMDNNEGLWGKIMLTKLPAAHGASAAWWVEGNMRPGGAGDNELILIRGHIAHTGGIGSIRFESATGNFNKTNSYVRAECRKLF